MIVRNPWWNVQVLAGRGGMRSRRLSATRFYPFGRSRGEARGSERIMVDHDRWFKERAGIASLEPHLDSLKSDGVGNISADGFWQSSGSKHPRSMGKAVVQLSRAVASAGTNLQTPESRALTRVETNGKKRVGYDLGPRNPQLNDQTAQASTAGEDPMR